MSEQRALVHRQETAQATQQALRENLSERRARAQVIDAHVADAAERLSTAKAQSETLEAQASRLEGDLTRAREEEASTREKLNALVVARDGARRALDEARTALTKSTAERAVLRSWNVQAKLESCSGEDDGRNSSVNIGLLPCFSCGICSCWP